MHVGSDEILTVKAEGDLIPARIDAKEARLRRNWRAAMALCAGYTALAVLAVWLTTAPLVKGGSSSRQNLGEVILFDAFFILGAIIACWDLLVQIVTAVTSHGISQLTIRGRKTMAWSEVTEVRTFGHALELRSTNAKIRINPFLVGGKPLVDLILQRTQKLSR